MEKTIRDDADVAASRRTLLKAAGVIAAFAATGVSQRAAAAAAVPEHSHHHHQHTVDLGRMRVVDHAMDCVGKGEACAQHCIDLFRSGDTSVADCADSVQEMIAACTVMAKLATYDSKHLKDMVRVCVAICDDCEKECRKHADKHAECRACADSCADCIHACKDYLAA